MAKISLEKGAYTPSYQTQGSVGFDLSNLEDVGFAPWECKLVRTGVTIEVPPAHALFIMPRSSLYRKYGLIMPHSIGLIDQDYCGPTDEVLLQLENVTDTIVSIPNGTRLAQGVFVKVHRSKFDVVNQIKEEDRGGFGSTS